MKGITVVLVLVALALVALLGYAMLYEDQIVAKDLAQQQGQTPSMGQGAGQGVTWHSSLGPALQEAKDRNGRVVVDFYASWCPPCKEFASKTLTDKKVQETLQGFVRAKIDVDSHGEDAMKYNVRSIPTHVILSADGQILHRKEGFLSPSQYIEFLGQGK